MNFRSLIVAAAAAVTALSGLASNASAALVNVALGGKPASQSSTAFGGVASRAADGNTNGNYGGNSVTHTDENAPGSNNPFWRIDLGATIPVESITIFNRTDCCSGRLSDIIVDFYDANNVLIASSPELNNDNGGNTNSNAGPVSLNVSMPAPVAARFVEVRRNASSIFGDPNISGDSAQENILSLAEVQIFADNLALGKPATQSSQLGGFAASNATNGDLGDFTHTASSDTAASLTVDLQIQDIAIDSVILHNRDSCCGERLRDIVLEVLDMNGNVLAISDILNPSNVLGSPAFLAVDFHEMFGQSLVGSMIRISRIASPGGGDGNNVLSLGEVQVFGHAVPEPMTAMLGLMGLAALATRNRRHRNA